MKPRPHPALRKEVAMLDRFPEEEFAQLKKMLLVYEWGLNVLLTKLQIIYEDFKNFSEYNPIEHITSRIKAPESIAKKLARLNFDVTAANAVKCLYDIAGIRIICPFARDIFRLVDILKSLPETSVIKEKDYVANPKPSGYRSYHIIMEIPVFFSGKTEKIPVEVQIRTHAMNCWATLDHMARYKYQEGIPRHLGDELVACADKIAELDHRMFMIHDIVSLINRDG